MDQIYDGDLLGYPEQDLPGNRTSFPAEQKNEETGCKSTFGSYLRRLRLAKGHNLRDFCRRYAYDPGNWSKVERDLLPAPSDYTALRQLADALGLADPLPQRAALFDLAALQQGRIPADLLEDGAHEALSTGLLPPPPWGTIHLAKRVSNC